MVKYIYNCSDKILISSRSFKESIVAKGNYEQKLIYFPNWAEDSISKGISNFPIPEIPSGFTVMFAGNIGVAQDMDSIMKAALVLKDELQIQFVIIGDGRSKEVLVQFIKDHNLHRTVHLMGRFPIDAMKTLFSHADALLVTLKDEMVFNLTVPAKLQAYLCTQKPILGMLNGEGAKIIQDSNCGLVTSAGHYIGLAQIILDLSIMPEAERAILGNNGFNYYNKNFTLDICISNLEQILKSSN
jgi:glycosyltransferase involved in cell wall biosynthesis